MPLKKKFLSAQDVPCFLVDEWSPDYCVARDVNAEGR